MLAKLMAAIHALGHNAPEPEPESTKRCRCCGKIVHDMDLTPIHTKCIPTHWARHVRKINVSRCVEFNPKTTNGGKS